MWTMGSIYFFPKHTKRGLQITAPYCTEEKLGRSALLSAEKKEELAERAAER